MNRTEKRNLCREAKKAQSVPAKQQLWTKRASVTRRGTFFYTADIARWGKAVRVTVCLSPLGRWLTREGERELPATWATPGEAKRYAEVTLEFGRFAPAAPADKTDPRDNGAD